jgi:VWFA-related protein
VLDVLAPIVRHLAAAPGTRILLIVSPGFVTDGMERQLGGLTDTCLRAHIVVNALDDEGLLSGGRESPESLGAQDGLRANWAERTLAQRTQAVTAFLADAAAATGGQFIRNSNGLTGGLRTLAAVPEVSYLLGFSPSAKPAPAISPASRRSRPKPPSSASIAWSAPASYSTRSRPPSKSVPWIAKMAATRFR